MKRFLFAMLCIVSALGMRAQTWTGNEVTEGTFYLYNVAAGKFLNNGDPNQSWGTNAYLQTGFGMDIVLEANGEAYNLNTNVSNGGNSHYLANSTWCDGDATPWTFRAVEGETNVYQIIYNGEYLMANETLNDVEMLGDPGSRTTSTYWKLVSENDFKAAMQAKVYSTTDPMDVSIFIKGRSFARNDGRNNTWVRTYQNENNQKWIEGSNNKYYGNEFWNQTFDIHQEITGLPDGTYEVQCSGFGTNGTTIIYGNTKEGTLTSENSAANGSRQTAYQLIADENAWSGQTTGTFTLSGGNLTVGLKRETNKSADWCVYDEFRLYYYGLDLSEFAATLAEAVAAAEAVEGTIPTAAYQALAAVVSEQNQTYTSAADYTAATNAIVAATNTAKTLQANYSRYNSVKTAVLAISNTISTTDADAQVEAATTNEDIEVAVQTVRTALANYLPTVTLSAGQTIDLTDALIDNPAPGISGNTDYWTNSNNPGLEYNLYEFYNIAGATTKQTIATSLPAGNYKLTAIAFTRTGYEAKLNAGEHSTNIAQVESGTVNNRNQGNNWIAEGNGNGVTDLVFNLVETTANLEIGLTASNNGDKWMCWRSFSLVYGDVFEPYTLVEGKMNADVAAAQTAADNAFKATPSPDTYMAVLEAITAAEASVNAYIPMTAAVTKIDAALEAATSATASTEAYDAIKATYTAGTIADVNIMTNVVAAYNAVIPVIKSQTAANADFTLAIQNQSFEYGDMTGWNATASSDTGVRETANATYSTDGADGKYLFNTWWQGVPLTQTIEGLPNGQYTLTVTVASDGATIYLLANEEHNDGTLTTDKTIGLEATFTFLVKDGNATIGVVGGAEDGSYLAEGYWWYKADNFRLVKNRELTPEEMAVIPTAIALDQTEVELTATVNTITLTPTFTPEDATNTVTWTTSDANVATVVDGVVTAVLPGTATITVTSTLDENVSATCEVTVTYPETEVASEDYINEGAQRTVVTYGENLIKNGTFEYPNPFYGWKSGANGNCDSNNFNIVTDGDHKYLQAKESQGGGNSHSIKTAWSIETGKTYVFGYRVKANSAGNSQYHVVSMTNTIGTETAKVSNDATPVTTEWSEVKYKFTNTNGYAYVQFMARWLANNTSFDDFYLVEVADESIVGNVEYATNAIPTANIGTGAFQYSQDAVDAASALVQGTATVADVEAAYAALTTINEPTDGQLFNVILTYNGWTYDNKAVTYLAGDRTDMGGYNIKYQAEANQNLAQAFTFTKVEGNNYKMSQIDADGNVRYVSTGVPHGGNTSQIRTVTNADDALVVTVIPTTTEGKWNLKNTEANQYIGSQDAGFFTVNSHIDFIIVETQKPSIVINTTAAGWGTTMLPFAAEKPADVKVYTCAAADGASLTLVEVDALEANKPYIIEGAWSETLTDYPLGTALQVTEGLLVGTYERIAAPNGAYILQKQNDKVGFYKVDTSVAQPNVPANRAYVNAPTSGVKAFFLDDATGINGVIDALQNGDIYDLAGRKIQRMQKGNIYIVNGRKVVVK